MFSYKIRMTYCIMFFVFHIYVWENDWFLCGSKRFSDEITKIDSKNNSPTKNWLSEWAAENKKPENYSRHFYIFRHHKYTLILKPLKVNLLTPLAGLVVLVVNFRNEDEGLEILHQSDTTYKSTENDRFPTQTLGCLMQHFCLKLFF